MRIILCTLVMLVLAGINAAAADNPMKIRQIGNGWIGFTKQSDPFDKSKVEAFQISKDGFTFRCGELNMGVSSYGFESLSFDAELKYMIDDHEPVEKKGTIQRISGARIWLQTVGTFHLS